MNVNSGIPKLTQDIGNTLVGFHQQSNEQHIDFTATSGVDGLTNCSLNMEMQLLEYSI